MAHEKLLMREYDVPHWRIADMDSLLKIVKTTPLPVTVRSFEMLKVLKGAKGEFVYELVNVVRGHGGMKGLDEPEGWKEGWNERRKVIKAAHEKEDEVKRLKGIQWGWGWEGV